MKRWIQWIKQHVFLVSLLILLIAASLIIPFPYYIYQPGSADPVQPRVTVEGGKKDEKGSLMLTTVSSLPVSNIYIWIYGHFAKDAEFVPKKQVDGDIPISDYSKILRWMMDDSEINSEIAAMKFLGKPISVQETGIEIGSFTSNSQAKNDLRTGDIIVEADGKPIRNLADFQHVLSNKKPGDRVVISAKREDRLFRVTVPVTEIPADSAGNPAHPGIGFRPLPVRTAKLSQAIQFHTDDIGGPSAGMMLSLEIISQLTPGDLTKGHQIAGTGTIDPDGHVGQIGGIQHKIVAAERAHADIFLVPKDLKPGDTNEKLAELEIEKDHSQMKIVPVATLSDAVSYLMALH